MNYLIIGASAAGISAIEAIKNKDKEAKITLVSDEEFPLYSRCLLSYFISGEIDAEKLHFRKDDFFTSNKVIALLGKRAVKIDAKAKTVTLSDNKVLKYDKLLLAHGGTPQLPDMKGADTKGVFTLRTIKDAQAIRAKLPETKEAVILGGGLVGLKAAYALGANNIKVTVIVKSNQILSQTTDEPSALLIEKHIAQHNIKVLKGKAATEILGKDKVEGVMLDDGTKLSCQMVVIGKGVTPNIELVKGTGIDVDWGIKVDKEQKTNVSDIYAAGDCAQTLDVVRGELTVNALWPLAIEQGRIAGLNMAGENIKYDGSVTMNSIDFFGLPIITTGVTRSKDDKVTKLTREKGNVYKRLYLKDNKITGMVMVGDIDQAGVINSLIRKRIDVGEIAEEILNDNFDFGKIISLIEKNQDKFKEPEYTESVR